ncbi:hypothetical protein CYMTET_32807, partial [Cymbomonas tetramitiformis]
KLPMLHSSPGKSSASVMEIRLAETGLFRLKQFVDEQIFRGHFKLLEAECAEMQRDVSLMYPQMYVDKLQVHLTGAFIKHLKQLPKKTSRGGGVFTEELRSSMDGAPAAEGELTMSRDGKLSLDAHLLVNEEDMAGWVSELISKVLIICERKLDAKDAAHELEVAELHSALEQAHKMEVRREEERGETELAEEYRILQGVTDKGLQLFHRCDQLRRTVAKQDEDLSKQEETLQRKVHREFDDRLLQLDREVKLATTREQRHKLETKERLLNDLANIRKETTLRLVNKSWQTDGTGEGGGGIGGARASAMEMLKLKSELDATKGRCLHLEQTLLMLQTLSRLRAQVRETSLQRRITAFMQEWGDREQMAWDEMAQAQAKMRLLEEQLASARKALKAVQVELKKADKDVSNERRQRGKLVQWKVKAARNMHDLEDKVRKFERWKESRAETSEGPESKEEVDTPRSASVAGTGMKAARKAGLDQGNQPQIKRELNLEKEILRLKSKVAQEQKLKQEALTELHKFHRRQPVLEEGITDGEQFERLQSQQWQEKYSVLNDKLKGVELENQQMREALQKIESLVPGMTESLVPSGNFSRPPSAQLSPAAQRGTPLSSRAKTRPNSAAVKIQGAAASIPGLRPTSAPMVPRLSRLNLSTHHNIAAYSASSSRANSSRQNN